MEKRIIGIIAFVAIAVAAGWNSQQNKRIELFTHYILEKK